MTKLSADQTAPGAVRRTGEGQDHRTVLAFPTPLDGRHGTRRRDVPEDHYTTVELAHLTGLSYRRLDYWARTGLLRSTNAGLGTGSVRCHPASEIPVMRLIDRLTFDGVDVRVAHDLARDLLTTGSTVLAGIRLHLPQEL